MSGTVAQSRPQVAHGFVSGLTAELERGGAARLLPAVLFLLLAALPLSADDVHPNTQSGLALDKAFQVGHFLADGRLSQIRDGFTNQVNITYGNLVWTITDSREDHAVVSTEAPTTLVNSSTPHSAAAEGAGVYILNEDLPTLSPAQPVPPNQ